MIVKEKYIHTRNYGCRIRRYTMDGVRMLSMENQCLKVVFALDKGADIVELVYKPRDVDLMWHSFNELKSIKHMPTTASEKGNFMHGYVGGWQELFPTYGSPASWQGAQIGQHGEACIYPWECEVLEDLPERIKIKLSVRLLRSPFSIEKEVTLGENSTRLLIKEKITNEGAATQTFMWGQHPALGWPFIDENTRLEVKGKPQIIMSQAINPSSPVEPGATGTWPLMQGKDGKPVDMSRAYAHEERISMEYGLCDLEEGTYRLVNEKLGLGFRMEWDLEKYPYLWIWGMYCGHESFPWYGRAYTMAVEPWSSMPANYDAALANGCVHRLGAGESTETEIAVEIIPI